MARYEVRRDGRSVGHVLVQPDHQKPGGSLVEDLYVEPEYRRQGLGRQLLAQAKQGAGEGPLRIRPRPFKDMPANIESLKSFYASEGFKPTGDTRDNMVLDKLAFSACVRHLTKLATEDDLSQLKKMQEELELKAHKGLASDADKALYKSNFEKIENLTPRHLKSEPGWKAWQPPKPSMKAPAASLTERATGLLKRHPVAALAGAGALYGGFANSMKHSLMTKGQHREATEDVQETGGPISRFALNHPGAYGALMGGASTGSFVAALPHTNVLGSIGAALAPAVGTKLVDRGLRSLEDRRASKAGFEEAQTSPVVAKPKSGPAVAPLARG